MPSYSSLHKSARQENFASADPPPLIASSRDSDVRESSSHLRFLSSAMVASKTNKPAVRVPV